MGSKPFIESVVLIPVTGFNAELALEVQKQTKEILQKLKSEKIIAARLERAERVVEAARALCAEWNGPGTTVEIWGPYQDLETALAAYDREVLFGGDSLRE